MTWRKQPFVWVFVILFPTYAFFWHGRDWNTASRLMLTYALVDRGTLSINGLEDQTGDKAVQGGRFYSDKLPGYSLLATAPYAAAKLLLRLPDHPLNRPGFAYWGADYWITLFTSGLFTALTGALLTSISGQLGCGPKRSALVGLSYGLATPALVYGCLAYGHQVSAFCLLLSFSLLWNGPGATGRGRAFAAGFLASYASVVELQVGPVSAILGFYLIALVIGRTWPLRAIWLFGLGALVPTLILFAYHYLAFGSPLTMGYFLHANPRFRAVHSASNPLGISGIDWSLTDDLLWGTRRGLFWYAPILLLAAPGLIVLAARKRWGMVAVAIGVMLSVFVVNLSYPEWTGGWSTGPRLLLPLIPFAMLGVAGLIAVGGRWTTGLGIALTLLGGVIVLLFAGIGGRIPEQAFGAGAPDPFAFPLRDAVLPVWMGERLPGWLFDVRFARNLTQLAAPDAVRRLDVSWQWIQFGPLLLFQALMIGLMMLMLRERPVATVETQPPASSAG